MTYVIVQLLVGFGAFLGTCQVVNKEISNFDKVLGFVSSVIYLAIILYIEVMLK